MLQHKSGEIDGFTKRYNIDRLVYYEIFHQVGNAIAREKQIKSWTRAKRLALIKTKNPTWQDLAEGWGEKIQLRAGPPLVPLLSLPTLCGFQRVGSTDPRVTFTHHRRKFTHCLTLSDAQTVASLLWQRTPALHNLKLLLPSSVTGNRAIPESFPGDP